MLDVSVGGLTKLDTRKIHFQSKNVHCYQWRNSKSKVHLRTGHEGPDGE